MSNRLPDTRIGEAVSERLQDAIVRLKEERERKTATIESKKERSERKKRK